MSFRTLSSPKLAPLLLLALPAWAADVSVTLGAGNGFSIKNNTGAVERLRVDEATGNVSRNGALFVHTTGSTSNTFVGALAGSLATTGIRNSAFGEEALTSNTTGGYNSAFGRHALRANGTGVSNSAFGYGALRANTANNNSAFGSASLRANTEGAINSAFGQAALQFNTTGSADSAFGQYTLRSNTTGNGNSAFGQAALRFNTTGNDNSAFGEAALYANTTGSFNVALGYFAGLNQTTGNDNIYIANFGVAGESGKIKIGNANHTDTFIEGIFGNTASGGSAVFINSSNELGTATSSIRFKEAVRGMGEASEKLRQLRPVVFRYRAEEGQPASGVDEYGLIAEEVAKVAPELVVNDADGKPYSVRYHVLPALLLNELQQQQRTIEALTARIAELERRSSARVAAR